jgi:hypothetical protein
LERGAVQLDGLLSTPPIQLVVLGQPRPNAREDQGALKTRVVIDERSPGRVFEGIGAIAQGGQWRLLVDYPERQRTEILDTLFNPAGSSEHGAGAIAGFQHLKVEIGGDGFSGQGAEASHMRAPDDLACDRGYMWWLMEEARARNPAITFDALAWTHPGWIGEDIYNRRGLEYVMAFVECVHRRGLSLSHVGVFNEDIREEPEIVRRKYLYIKNLKRCLDSAGYSVGVVALDLFWEIVDAMAEDDELRDAVDVVSAHYVHETPDYVREFARRWQKSIWSGEDAVTGVLGIDEPRETVRLLGEWYGGLRLARVFNQQYISGLVTRTSLVYTACGYYDMLYLPGCGLMSTDQPWAGHYAIQPALWAVAHTTQFAQPGWRYLDDACGFLRSERGRDVGTYVTRTDGKEWSLVVETGGSSADEALQLRLAVPVTSPLARQTIHVWRSSAEEQFAELGSLESTVVQSERVLALPLEPGAVYTLTTLSGRRQDKPDAVPMPARFPLPYRDHFERLSTLNVPRYLATQKGSFELAEGAGDGGATGLAQVVTQPATDWVTGNFDYTNLAFTPAPGWSIGEPYAVAGDLAWTDYQVAVTAAFGQTAEARAEDAVGVLGRVQAGRPRVYQGGEEWDEFDYRRRGCYELRQLRDGSWALRRHTVDPRRDLQRGLLVETLAAGGTSPVDGWRVLELVFRGLVVEAVIAGQTVARVVDDAPEAHAHGGFGLTTGWHAARFACLVVEPVSSDTVVVDDAEVGPERHRFEYRDFSPNGGDWTRQENSVATDHQGGHTESAVGGSRVRFSFEGRRVLLFGTKAPDGGYARITLDGQEQANVDFFREAEPMGNELVYHSPVIAPGEHTLDVEVAGTGNPGSRGSFVRIDRADVIP